MNPIAKKKKKKDIQVYSRPCCKHLFWTNEFGLKEKDLEYLNKVPYVL
jgi:hypothetical protein